MEVVKRVGQQLHTARMERVQVLVDSYAVLRVLVWVTGELEEVRTKEE